MWNLDWSYLAIRCFAFQGHFVLSTAWDGCYQISLCLIPVHMYRCLQCAQAWQISTKAPFEADFKFPSFWPWQKYLGVGRAPPPPCLWLPEPPGCSDNYLGHGAHLFWLAGKDSGAVRVSGARGKGLIGTKRGWPTVHSPWLCTDLGSTRNVGSTELHIWWIWLCSRIWT